MVSPYSIFQMEQVELIGPDKRFSLILLDAGGHTMKAEY